MSLEDKKLFCISEDQIAEWNDEMNPKPQVLREAPVTEEQSMMELAKSMDWKLWEMLQILQRLEKKLSSDAEKED